MGVYNNNNGTLELISGATLWADAPIGCIQAYGGATAPDGWLICNGAAVSRTTYAALFAVVGTSFGAGDGTTTFNVPDLREATIKGAGLTGLSNNHMDADGLAVGEFLDDRIQDITGDFDYTTGGSPQNNLNLVNTNTAVSGVFKEGIRKETKYVFAQSGGQYTGSSLGFDASLVARTGATTEVKSVGVNYIIKAQQVAVPADFEGAAEAAGTAAAEEVVAQKVTKFSGTDSGNTYVTVDSLAYDQTNNALGLKVNGADTVIPFIRPNNFSTDARGRKPIMFALDTYRMAVYDENTGEMAVDENYFEVISKAVQTGTYRIFSMQIKAKKSFSLRMYGGYYNGTFGFEPLFATTPSLGAINQTFNIVEGTTYTWNNYRSGEIDNASACCYGVVVSE